MLNQFLSSAKKTASWVTQEKHVEHLRNAQSYFTTHPHETGESYLVHLWFTVKMGLKFGYVSSVIIIHGIFPFLFTKTASIQVEKLYKVMKSRIPKKRLEELDRERLYARKRHECIAGDARIAIIGGGFSGVAVLATMVRRASGPLTIEWFDASDTFGTGLAYGTKLNEHLLNVRTKRMGVFAGEPEGFHSWLMTQTGKTAAAQIWPGRNIDSESYVPRKLYGAYLRDIMEQSFAEAKNKGILINTHRAGVQDATLYNADAQQITLSVEDGTATREVLVDALVLATGNLPPRNFNFLAGIIDTNSNYVPDVWNVVEAPEFTARVQSLSADSEIVILGSGLTMIDMLLTLKAKGYKGKVTVISRGGAMPAVHTPHKDYAAWLWSADPRQAPATALGLLRGLRAEVKRAEANGDDWRAVIDSLRPVTQILWQRLSVHEKRRFLTKLSTLWSIHRHRMAPEIYAEVEKMLKAGTLTVVSGTIYHVGSEKDGLTLSYRKRGTNIVETLQPALVLNCTGPESDIANSGHTLLKNLRDKDLITVGPLRVGIEVTANGSAKGSAPDTLYPVGPLLAGEYLECTSVPELRDVASKVADHVLNRVQMISHRDVNEGLSLGEWI